MKTQRNILIAFIVNLLCSVLECIGGLITGSFAIISDSIHDLGDALSIGVSYFLEKKSRKEPDNKFTYGYMRYSVIGGVFTITILLIGSVLVIIGSVNRIMNPVEIKYNRMIFFAVSGVIMNFLASWVTREGDSINQKAVNLHMLEDVMGWIVVLIGSVIMKFTDISIIDPLMSIGVSIFIFINAIKELKDIADLFLEKVPEGISVEKLANNVKDIEGVLGVHHIHIWSMDGYNRYATMHVITDCEHGEIKQKVRKKLSEHGISHVTLELEKSNEDCGEENCRVIDNRK